MKKRFVSAVVGILLVVGLVAIGVANGLSQEVGSGGSIVSSELIFPLQPEHAHGSSLVELSNGDFLAVWFQGSGERTANDVRLLGARLRNGGLGNGGLSDGGAGNGASAWSEPFPMADTPGIPDCNPVLFLNSKKKLFLVWIAVLADRWESSILRVRTTTDYLEEGGPRWEWQENIFFKPTEEFITEVDTKWDDVTRPNGVTDEAFAKESARIHAMARNFNDRSIGWMTRIPPILLPSGRILLPLYSDGFNFSMVAISDDDGETWLPSRPIVGLGIQPSLARQADGTITAYMRNASGDPERVWISHSQDQGETWTLAERSDLASTASVNLFALADGRWVYVAGDTESGRWRLSLFVSSDEGKMWKRGETLEHDTTHTNRYSYPCLLQSADGKLHVTYSCHLEKERTKSIKHVVLDPTKF